MYSGLLGKVPTYNFGMDNLNTHIVYLYKTITIEVQTFGKIDYW